MQLTVWDAMEQVQLVPVAPAGVKPTGSVSFTVTVPLVEPYGLTFSTGMV